MKKALSLMIILFVCFAGKAWADDPAIVVCTANTWVKVATDVTKTTITPRLTKPTYLYTWRDTGNTAPTNNNDALPLPIAGVIIDISPAVDVYVKARNYAGSVRVGTATGVPSDNIIYEATTIGAGDSQRGDGRPWHTINWEIEPTSVTPVSAATIILQGSPDNSGANNGAINSPGIAIGSTPENFANDLFYSRILSVNYSKAANIAGTAFSAAHAIAASKYGAINIYIDAAGIWTTRINSAAQTDTLSFDTALLAIANADADTAPANNIRVGMIVIQNDGSLWTANTDDLTDASDITKAGWYSLTSSFTEINHYNLNADDFIAQKGAWYLSDSFPSPWVRIYLSIVTGEGNFIITNVLTE